MKHLLIAVAFYIIFGGALSGAADDTLWVRGIAAHSTSGPRAFFLSHFQQDGLHVTGMCAYERAKDLPALTMHGTQTYNGEFWPNVISQVKNEKTGKWETVSLPLNYGSGATIEIKPGELRQNLLVTLDVFVPLAKRYKVGRVVLENGEAAEFELLDILPGIDAQQKH